MSIIKLEFRLIIFYRLKQKKTTSFRAWKDKEWVCPECSFRHDRDVNASRNLKKEGIRILKEKNITVISSNDENTIGTMEIHAFGDRVRPYSVKATVNELGIHLR